MKSFPNPLTPSEEKEYIQKYTEGDLQAKHILIERNLRLVAHVIKKYQYVDEDPEDLISIGTIGLIKAIVTFNPSKGNRLAAYASKCVENEILMHLRARKKTSKEISLYEPIGTDREGNEIKLYDIIETDEDDIPERVCLKENIQKGSRQTTGDLPFLCIPDRKERGRKATRLFLLFVRYHICPPSDPAPHITPVLSEEHSPAPLLLH